jgi:DNA-binding response OmpR family regulator
MRILVIEDDVKVANFVQAGLQQEGHAVDVLHEGSKAGEQALAVDYDAVVLDVMLPGRSGFQVLRDIRARKASLPVLMLTAKDSVDDRVAGLDAGADDYLVKPFAFAELLARVQALIRRGTGAAEPTRLHVGDLVFLGGMRGGHSHRGGRFANNRPLRDPQITLIDAHGIRLPLFVASKIFAS